MVAATDYDDDDDITTKSSSVDVAKPKMHRNNDGAGSVFQPVETDD